MQLKEFDIVNNMKDVGPKTRSRLITEIGDIRRFKNINCLIAFCGIYAPQYQ
ncbi:MAG: transposase [Bacilli bacterium]|nr:transposase [Bacilli bacterium]